MPRKAAVKPATKAAKPNPSPLARVSDEGLAARLRAATKERDDVVAELKARGWKVNLSRKVPSITKTKTTTDKL